MGDTEKKSNATDHMANERTYLAWIRTSIGIMAFGFVVDKFAIFMRQLPHLFGNGTLQGHHATDSMQGYSSVFGIFLVGLGTIISILAFVKYKTVEKQIDTNTYRPSYILDLMMTSLVLLIGIFLAIYLGHSYVDLMAS